MKSKYLDRRLSKERVQDSFVMPDVYAKYRKMVDDSFPHLSEEERDAETRIVCHTHPDSPHVQKPAPDPKAQPAKASNDERLKAAMMAGLLILGQIVVVLLCVLIYLVLFSDKAHAAGTSQIDVIKATDGTHTVVAAAPFKMTFAGCTVGGTGSAWTITCAGSAANPGGSAHQLQVNSAGTAFAGISNGTAGQVLCSNGTSSDPAMCDPVVSGPDAPGVAPTKPPVQVGLFDGTNVQRILGSAAGRLSIDVNSAPTTAVTGTFWQSTQPVSIADGSSVTLGAKADAKSTATDTTAITLMQVLKEISAMAQAPASTPITAAALPLPSGAATAAKQPALGTAGSASADVISIQGIASMTAVKTDGSGVTQPVSGTVTANQGGTWTVQPGNTANTTAWKVDGSAVTQPVSGSVTVTQATGTNLHTVCDSGCSSSTAPADASAFTESTTSFSPVGGYFRTSPTSLTTDHMGVVGMTATRHLFVNLPDALPAGTNVIGHVIADTGSTTAVTGNVAVTVADGANVTLGAKADAKSTATDTTAVTIMQVLKEISALEQAPASRAVTNAGTFATQATLSAETTKVIGTVNIAAAQTVTTSPPANASTNIAQVSGAVTSATNPLYTRETDGTNPVILDPCRTQANIFKPISQTASAQLVTGTSAKKIYICSINLVTAAANNVAMVEGTGTVCATGIAGMAGGTTAATGWNFAANGGLTQGNGMGSIMAEATNADNLCLLQSAAVQLSGTIGYVVQ